MQKIAIMGLSGAGKTTLARELHELTDLPVISFDASRYVNHVETRNWSDRRDHVVAQLNADKWIMDGGVQVFPEIRHAAECIVFLKPRKPVIFVNLIKRFWQNGGKLPEDFSNNRRPRIDLWTCFRRAFLLGGVRRKMQHAFASAPDWVERIVIDTPESRAAFLARISAAHQIQMRHTPQEIAAE